MPWVVSSASGVRPEGFYHQYQQVTLKVTLEMRVEVEQEAQGVHQFRQPEAVAPEVAWL